MKILSIFFLLLGLFAVALIPKSRKWIWGKVINNNGVRRTLIKVGMGIPPIRKRVVNQIVQQMS